MERSSRSRALQEVVGFALLASLCTAWILLSFFPEGGLTSLTSTAARAATAALGVAVTGTVLGWLLRVAGLIPWSPGVRSYALWRQRQAQRRRALEERRVEAQQAVWRAVESLPEIRAQDSGFIEGSQRSERRARQSA